MIKIKTFLLATLLLTGLVFPATAQIGEPRSNFSVGVNGGVNLNLSLIHISEPTRPY